MHGKLGVRNTFFLINLFMFILIYASSYCNNLYLFSVLFSIGGSWTTGGYIYTGIKCLYTYFTKKNQKAIAGGVTISGQALISILTTNFALYYINPKNEPAINGEYFSKKVAMRVPDFIRALAILYFIAGFIGTFLILDPLPESKEEVITENQNLLAATAGSEDNKTDAATQPPTGAHHEGEEKKSAYELIMQILQAFQNPIFFRLMTIKVICTIGMFFFAFSFKAIYLKSMPHADRFVTFATNVTMIPNILSRLVGGVLYNKLKFTISQSTVSILLCITIILLVPCAASRSYTLFLGVLCTHYACFGFAFTMHMMVFEDAFDKLGVL